MLCITVFELKNGILVNFQTYNICYMAFCREKKRGSFLCSSDMLIAISFEIEFLLENVWFLG